MKRIILMGTAIAIVMIASTTNVSCQTVKGVLRAATEFEKGFSSGVKIGGSLLKPGKYDNIIRIAGQGVKAIYNSQDYKNPETNVSIVRKNIEATVSPASFADELRSSIVRQDSLMHKINSVSQYANNIPVAKHDIKNFDNHHLLSDEYGKRLCLIDEFGSQNSNNFVTNFCINKETLWSHLSLCDKKIEIGPKVAPFMKMEPEYIFSFTKPFDF